MIDILKNIVNLIEIPNSVNSMVDIAYVDRVSTPSSSAQNMEILTMQVYQKSCNIIFNEKKDVIVDKVIQFMDNLAKNNIIDTFSYNSYSEEKERELNMLIMKSTHQIMQKSMSGYPTGIIFPNHFINEFLYSVRYKDESIYNIDIDRDLFKFSNLQCYGSNKTENIIVFKASDDRKSGLNLLCSRECGKDSHNYSISETGIGAEDNFVAIKTNNRKAKISRLLRFFNRE